MARTGLVVRGLHAPGRVGERVKKALSIVLPQQPNIQLLSTPEDFVKLLSPDHKVEVRPPGRNVRGYHNPTGGWANASAAIN